LSRRLDAFKYKRSQVPDERKTIRKAYGAICRTLSSKRDHFNKCDRTGVTKHDKIHPVVNVSRVCRYKDQVEGQRKE